MSAFLAWWGDLGPQRPLWGSLAPLALVLTYAVAGLCVFIARNRALGAHVDGELEHRGASVLLGMRARVFFGWLTRPIWRLLVWSGVPADALTTLAVLLALASAVALATGSFGLGGWLYLASGTCDFFDGRLARHTGHASRQGAVLDSVLDRYVDSAVLCGLAWYYRTEWVWLAAMVALVGSQLVPYVRAKGEAHGISVHNGIMQRAERVVYLGALLVLSPAYEAIAQPGSARPTYLPAVLGLLLLAVATQITVLQRLAFLLTALDDGRVRGARRVQEIATTAMVVTLLEFGAFASLSSHFHGAPWLAAGVAGLGGGVLSALLRRARLAESDSARVRGGARHSFVIVTSALLTAGGVGVVLMLPHVSETMAWWVARVCVSLAWTYPVYRGAEPWRRRSVVYAS